MSRAREWVVGRAPGAAGLVLGVLFTTAGVFALTHDSNAPYPASVALNAAGLIGGGIGFLVLGLCFLAVRNRPKKP